MKMFQQLWQVLIRIYLFVITRAEKHYRADGTLEKIEHILRFSETAENKIVYGTKYFKPDGKTLDYVVILHPQEGTPKVMRHYHDNNKVAQEEHYYRDGSHHLINNMSRNGTLIKQEVFSNPKQRKLGRSTKAVIDFHSDGKRLKKVCSFHLDDNTVCKTQFYEDDGKTVKETIDHHLH